MASPWNVLTIETHDWIFLFFQALSLIFIAHINEFPSVCLYSIERDGMFSVLFKYWWEYSANTFIFSPYFSHLNIHSFVYCSLFSLFVCFHLIISVFTRFPIFNFLFPHPRSTLVHYPHTPFASDIHPFIHDSVKRRRGAPHLCPPACQQRGHLCFPEQRARQKLFYPLKHIQQTSPVTTALAHRGWEKKTRKKKTTKRNHVKTATVTNGNNKMLFFL